MEIPSSHAGVVKELQGQGRRQGVARARAIAIAAKAPAAPRPRRRLPPRPPAPRRLRRRRRAASRCAAAGEKRSPTAALPAHEPTAPQGALPHASPSIRKLARELGVPLDEVKGSGPKGRITQEDVQGFVKGVMAGTRADPGAGGQGAGAGAAGGGAFPGLLPWPQVDFTKFGPVERKDLSRIKKISGANLHRNWVMIPHVTNHDDADITELEALPRRSSTRRTRSPASR